MSFIRSNRVRNITGLTNAQEQRIRDFLQGAVYDWFKNHQNEWFSLRDLMGGANTNWTGTPMEELYEKHIKLRKTAPKAVKQAGIDGGHVLARVMELDRHRYDFRQGPRIKQYRRV